MLWNWAFCLTFVAYCLTLFNAGTSRPMRITMILITVSSSTIVKAALLLFCLMFDLISFLLTTFLVFRFIQQSILFRYDAEELRVVMICIIGAKMARTMVITMLPRQTIMIGSSMDISEATSTSTCSS